MVTSIISNKLFLEGQIMIKPITNVKYLNHRSTANSFKKDFKELKKLIAKDVKKFTPADRRFLEQMANNLYCNPTILTDIQANELKNQLKDVDFKSNKTNPAQKLKNKVFSAVRKQIQMKRRYKPTKLDKQLKENAATRAGIRAVIKAGQQQLQIVTPKSETRNAIKAAIKAMNKRRQEKDNRLRAVNQDVTSLLNQVKEQRGRCADAAINSLKRYSSDPFNRVEKQIKAEAAILIRMIGSSEFDQLKERMLEGSKTRVLNLPQPAGSSIASNSTVSADLS